MKKLSFTLLLGFLCSSNFAQSTYRVFLTDKGSSHFNPEEFFDQKALERRRILSIPMDTLREKPLDQHYINELEKLGTIKGKSRWLNMVYLIF